MGCVVQLTGLSHDDFHFLSKWSLYESNNSTQKIPTSGRKVFRLSMNFGYHLAVGPPSGSTLWWLKKIPKFLQKQKSLLPSAHFGLFPPYRTTVLAHFWLFLPSGPLWIMNMDLGQGGTIFLGGDAPPCHTPVAMYAYGNKSNNYIPSGCCYLCVQFCFNGWLGERGPW
jgi:hypothetical protein